MKSIFLSFVVTIATLSANAAEMVKFNYPQDALPTFDCNTRVTQSEKDSSGTYVTKTGDKVEFKGLTPTLEDPYNPQVLIPKDFVQLKNLPLFTRLYVHAVSYEYSESGKATNVLAIGITTFFSWKQNPQPREMLSSPTVTLDFLNPTVPFAEKNRNIFINNGFYEGDIHYSVSGMCQIVLAKAKP